MPVPASGHAGSNIFYLLVPAPSSVLREVPAFPLAGRSFGADGLQVLVHRRLGGGSCWRHIVVAVVLCATGVRCGGKQRMKEDELERKRVEEKTHGIG